MLHHKRRIKNTRFFKRKHKNKNKRKTKKQRGGMIALFQVYLFTRTKLNEQEKTSLLNLLSELYGTNVNYISDFEDGFTQIAYNDIKEFVWSKGGYYPELTNIEGFSINTIPTRLNEGEMDDAKLTREEYNIRDAFKKNKLPFRLVDAQHGLWGEGTAIIAIEAL
jgi:hypothetical protein